MTIHRWFLMALAAPAWAQSALYFQQDFPAEEFRARWSKIYAKIGPEAVAVVQGAPFERGFAFPRQTNEFY